MGGRAGRSASLDVRCADIVRRLSAAAPPTVTADEDEMLKRIPSVPGRAGSGPGRVGSGGVGRSGSAASRTESEIERNTSVIGGSDGVGGKYELYAILNHQGAAGYPRDQKKMKKK